MKKKRTPRQSVRFFIVVFGFYRKCAYIFGLGGQSAVLPCVACHECFRGAFPFGIDTRFRKGILFGNLPIGNYLRYHGAVRKKSQEKPLFLFQGPNLAEIDDVVGFRRMFCIRNRFGCGIARTLQLFRKDNVESFRPYICLG